MVFLLDTMAFIRAYEHGLGKMPKRVQRIMMDTEQDLLLSAISLSEIAIKNSVRKLNFSLDRVNRAITDMRITVTPFQRGNAGAFFSLPFFEDHRDPFDRMLIATAMSENIPLISSDKHFKRYKDLQVIWK